MSHWSVTRGKQRKRTSHWNIRWRGVARCHPFISSLIIISQSWSTPLLVLNVNTSVFLPVTETAGAWSLCYNLTSQQIFGPTATIRRDAIPTKSPLEEQNQ